MGSHMSKKTTTETSSSAINLTTFQYTTDQLSSYEAACKVDADLQSFDTNLQNRTNQVITTLAAGVEVRALSFDSLKEEVVKVILECKKDIWKNQELFELVEEYFENSLQTLDFCTALEKCLKRARDSQLLILVALQQFEEETEVGGSRYTRTMEELKNFKTAGDPFTEEFFQICLRSCIFRKNKLDKKLKYINAWRKVSSIIFVATFAAVLICSVVAAAMAALPRCSSSGCCDFYPPQCRVGTYVAIKDLDSIRVLIDRLEIEIQSLMDNASFAIEQEA
ncbi:hypothetical protein J5N97_000303, partial [Dioscorea zingiberensis]